MIAGQAEEKQGDDDAADGVSGVANEQQVLAVQHRPREVEVRRRPR
jgi:hypothetical protein